MRYALTTFAAKSGRGLWGRDPTRTAALIRSYWKEIEKRMSELRRAIRQSVVGNDAFGLSAGGASPVGLAAPQPTASRNLTPIPPRKFQYLASEEKIEQFLLWVREQQAKGFLEVVYRPGMKRGSEAWSTTFLRSAYQRGLQKAQKDLVKAGAARKGYTPKPFDTAFYQPFHAGRAALLFARDFTQLKGVSEYMSAQMSNVLTKGVVRGDNPNDIARDLDDVLDIGMTRARLIARTEVIYTFNTANLAEYSQAESEIGEPVLVQWLTAGDDRVRETHVERNGKIYTREEAAELIGEPNCRCTLLPWIESTEKLRAQLAAARE